MSATVGWNSGASETEYPPAAPVGGHTTTLDIDSQGQYPRGFGPRSRKRSRSKGPADYLISSFTDSAEFFDFDSSAVFALDGPARTTFQAYWTRIGALRVDAAQDGYILSPDSEFDFWRFVDSEPHWRKGNLVLLDNGNLRAVWKDDQGTRFGLQFLGDGVVQYVIFKQRKAGQPTSRVTGRDTFEGLKRQIDAFELGSLLCQ